MATHDFESIYDSLFAYCEGGGFAGWDPFDGLRSAYFQATPLKHLAPARLAWLQMVKRSARNLRPALKIGKGVNAKGIALFALAELSRFRATYRPTHAANAKSLLDKLSGLVFKTRDGLAFGYNFDWQSRAFFAPEGTPTIVPTAFAAQAFLEAHALFGDDAHRETAVAICRFIAGELNRVGETADELSFSYTPIDRSVIFNASLLAAETLAATGGDAEWTELARRAANFVVRRQRADGAWAYGAKLKHAWVDNFHTAYILLSLVRLQKTVPGFECGPTVSRGIDYWLDNFFLPDGTPKYYDKETYPVDIHSASAAVAALAELRDVDPRCLPLAEKVAGWTVANMRDESGYFYYQLRRNGLVKTPFVRWSNAWTLYALGRLMEFSNVAAA